jgi:hypothetical protein
MTNNLTKLFISLSLLGLSVNVAVAADDSAVVIA